MLIGPTSQENWKDLKKILCVRLDALGDVLMTEPALRAIKESNPQARLSLLTSPSGAEAARLLSCVDEVIVFEAPWMKATKPREESSIDQSFIASLRSRGFEAAAIFTVYSQNPLPAALFCYLSEIPRRLAHCRESPYQLLTHWVPEVEPEKTVRHEVRRQLELVASVGCHTSDERMRLEVPEEARRKVRLILKEKGVDATKPFVVVHPGASAQSRRYPMEGFAAIVRSLSATLKWPIFMTGTEPERVILSAIQETARVPCHAVGGDLTLSEFAALLSMASLLISNNTGAVHVAAAVRTPVIDLYALTNPQHAPWLVPSRLLYVDVPCRYCYKSICPEGHNNCLRLVEPETVVSSALDLLGELGLLARQKKTKTRHPRLWNASSQGQSLPGLMPKAPLHSTPVPGGRV